MYTAMSSNVPKVPHMIITYHPDEQPASSEQRFESREAALAFAKAQRDWRTLTEGEMWHEDGDTFMVLAPIRVMN